MIRPAKDAAEVDQAYALEARVFGPDERAARARRADNDRLDPPSPKNVIIAVEDGEVAGLVRIYPKTLLLGGEKLSAGGVTHVCVAPERQGTGLGRRLMEWTLGELVRRGCDVSATIARRAVDGFYPRFGYVGVDAFPEQRVARLGPARLIAEGYRESSRSAYAAAYKAAYGRLPLSFDRSPAWWRACGERLRLKHPQLRWLNLKAGYALVDGEAVLEAAGDPSELLSGEGELVLRLPPAHPWLALLARRNHVFRTRAAWDGGHLLKVLDLRRFAAALRACGAPAAALKRFHEGRELLAHAAGTCLIPGCKLPELRLEAPLRPVWAALDEF